MLVSIITPVFNGASTLSDAILSVMKQTYKKWELLIIDDGSCDESLSVTAWYVKNDSRIKVFCTEENTGAWNARNIGLEQSKGSYIAFLDADDIWHPQKLEKQVKVLSHDCDSICCHTGYLNFRTDKKGRIVAKEILPKRSVGLRQLRQHNFIRNSTALVRRREVNNTRFNNVRHEDYEFWLRVLRNGRSVGLCEPLCGYRVHASQTSHNKMLSMLWHFEIVVSHTKNKLEIPFLAICYAWHHFTRIWTRKKVGPDGLKWLTFILTARP